MVSVVSHHMRLIDPENQLSKCSAPFALLTTVLSAQCLFATDSSFSMPPSGRTPIVPQPKTKVQAVAVSLRSLLCCGSDAITTSMLESSSQAERPGVSGEHFGFSGKTTRTFRPLIDLMTPTVLKGLRLPDKNQREILIPLQITQAPFMI